MNLDDPNLTAYALGEITDREEMAAIETWLKENSEGRAYVMETQETARFLRETLVSENVPGLTAEQRAALIEETDKASKIVEMPQAARQRKWSMIGLAALAACLAAAPLLPWAQLLRQRTAPTVAINTKTEPAESKMEFGSAPYPEAKKVEFPKLKQDEVTPRKEGTESVATLTLHKPFPAPTPRSNSATIPMDRARLLAGEPPPLPSMPSLPETNLPQPMLNVYGANGIASSAAAPVPQQPSAPSTADSVFGAGSGAGRGGVAREKKKSVSVYSDMPQQDGAMAPDFAGNAEAYESLPENGFLIAKNNPLSTFSIDVDTASYANVRRFLNDGQLPPKDAVRIEEMLNYFTYDYAKPADGAPFSTNLEVADCPWQPEHRLVRIGLKGREIAVADRKTANLVFLIDVSGSMDQPNKLPLLKQSLRLLIDQLAENDTVALTVYAGQSGLVLPATSNKDALRAALEDLRPGGSTNGASGIQLAYEEATKHFIKDGINRVILATDGDFNVGITSQSALVDLITAKAKSGVFLTVLGFGTGNIKDSTMEKLADKGNGNYAYIDSLREGKKVLVEQMSGTLMTIAKDVKIQVEFNPAQVSSYRLVGYENRALKKEDFNDDQKDAGEIGSGHTVTALYEVVPANVSGSATSEVDSLKYAAPAAPSAANPTSAAQEMLTVKLRYKEPAGDVSRKLEFPWTDKGTKLADASADFRFASAVAEAGMLLRQSANRQQASWEALISRAADAVGEDRGGYRAEFIELAKKARDLSARGNSGND